MAARQKSLIALVAAAVVAAAVLASGGLKASGDAISSDDRQIVSDPTVAGSLQASGAVRAPRRIISLVPALTEMLFAIGAGPQVIAVSSYDDFPPEARALPRVGALLDPDVERIFMLRPDLVVTYGSQGVLEAQLARAGIRAFSYRHGGIEALFQTLREVGDATGHRDGAEQTVQRIQTQLSAVRAAVRGRGRPRTLFVFGRQPQSLRQIYVSGGAGFLQEVLEIAGGVNVFEDVTRESVQPTLETLIARAPEVILDVNATRALSSADEAREAAVWSALRSVPAVRNGRIYFLSGGHLVVPGPRIGLAAEAFARALHPDAFK